MLAFDTVAGAPPSGPYETEGVVVTPVDTLGPTFAAGAELTITATSNSATISGPVATDPSGVVGYEYSINGGASYTLIANAGRTVSPSNLTPETTYQVRYRAIDTLGNRSAALSGSFTTAAAVQVEAFVVSTSRTIRILPGQRAYEAGSFWTVNGNSGPVGSKDPNSTIDIHFEWAAWLADIGDVPISNISFILGGGLTAEGVVPTATGGTIFVAGGVIGVNGTITCRITTATEPARIDDRTATLQIKDQ